MKTLAVTAFALLVPSVVGAQSMLDSSGWPTGHARANCVVACQHFTRDVRADDPALYYLCETQAPLDTVYNDKRTVVARTWFMRHCTQTNASVETATGFAAWCDTFAPTAATPFADAVRAIDADTFTPQVVGPGMPGRDRVYTTGMWANVIVMGGDVDSSARCFENNVRLGRRVCVEKVWPHSAVQDTPYFGVTSGLVTGGVLLGAHVLHRSGEERQARGEPGWKWRKRAANVMLWGWAGTRAVTVIENWDTLARVRSR